MKRKNKMPSSIPVQGKKNTIIVLKLSGRLFFSDEFGKVANLLKDVVKHSVKTKLVVVTGGAKIARTYIAAAQKLGVDQVSQDELGIQASRLNARVLSFALGAFSSNGSYSTIGELAEAIEVTERKKKIFVLGGIQPGQSTNAVAALASEKLGASLFVNATDVDGVYSKDPRKYKKAKLLSRVTTRQLAKILDKQSMKAGGYDLMDPIALKIIERSKLKTRIIRCDEKTLRSFLLGGRKLGTEIVS